MSKLHVAVLRGGPSHEYDLSLKTGASVLRHLPTDKYQAHDIFIAKDGTWHREGLERHPERALQGVDVVFNALHGEYGEGGKIQRMLDSYNIPYTGSDAVGGSVGLNRALAKKVFDQQKLKTPYYKIVKRTDGISDTLDHAFHHFLLPIVVKPATGRTVNVMLVQSFNDLEEALLKALEVSEMAIIEEYIKGKEATCVVVNHFRNEPTYTLLPVEIRNGEEIHPGNFIDAEKQEIQRLARTAHDALQLRHYSNAHFIVHPRRGVYIIEVNTLPHLSPETLVPRSLETVGATFQDFLDHVVTLAIEKR